MRHVIALVSAVLILLCGMFLAACGTQSEQEAVVHRSGEPDVHMVQGDDPEMNAAIATAQATLDSFFAELNAKKPNQRYFSVKVRIEQGDVVEHMWLDEPRYSADKVGGLLANEPLELIGYTPGQFVKVPREWVSDWMYVEDDVLRGGYTIRVLRERMTTQERAEFDATLDFVIP